MEGEETCRRVALIMIKDAVMELLKDSYENFLDKQFQLTVNLYEDGIIGMGAFNDKLLFAAHKSLRKCYQIASFS